MVMTGLCVAVSTTVLYYVPNNYHGLVMSGLSGWTIQLPEIPLVMKTGMGVDFRVKTPPREVDLTQVLNMDIITDDTLDMIVAIALPVIMLLLTLPITLTRVAMLGLDCIMIRRNTDDSEGGHHATLGDRRAGLGPRVTMTLCCGLVAGMVTTIIVLTAAVIVGIKIAS